MAHTTWNIDTTHSEIQFKVKHLVISTVTGSFKKFSGSVLSETDNFDGSQINFTLDVNSVDTNQADRDGHLKSPDFFDAANYPSIVFSGKLNSNKLTGDLTIKGISKTIELDVDFGGVTKDPWGNTKAGFEVSGKLNRKDFGLTWSAVTETGGLVVSEEVKLHINIELAKAQ